MQSTYNQSIVKVLAHFKVIIRSIKLFCQKNLFIKFKIKNSYQKRSKFHFFFI